MRPRVRRKYWDVPGIGFATCLCLVAGCAAVALAPCDKSRRIFTDSWGVITDGPSGSNYTENSHCEWLIKANNSKQFITLNFHNMGTECSYDYVFVYDGDSFKSPLLGSFSGKTDPQQISATSGYMLILLYSDTNYALHGFRAEFSVTECPNNCSTHGVCVDHKCYCFNNWGGTDCSRELCPDGCGSVENRGHCNQTHCKCINGYSGQACSLHKHDTNGNKWHWLTQSGIGLSPRAAHTAVYINYTDSLYVFGGYNLNKVLDSLEVYNFHTSRWEDENGEPLHVHNSDSSHPSDPSSISALFEKIRPENEQNWGVVGRNTFFRSFIYSINSNLTNILGQQRKSRSILEDDIQRPEARYGHAACAILNTFVVYGGKLSSGNLSNELWMYNILTKKWELKAVNSKLQPPALTRHTLTLANDYLYLFGGSTSDGEFSSTLFKIRVFIDLETNNVDIDENWEIVYSRGGKNLDIRLVAHSTVYYAATNSLIVYGGVAAGVARFSKLSDRMLTFHIENRHWSELHYPREHLRERYVPRERAFHTANIIGNYLIVFGGYSHRHNKEEICYDNQMYLYHLGCHAWVNPDVLGRNNDSRYPKKQGMFAHASSIRGGNTLILVGGYHGNVNGDLFAYVVPPSVGKREGKSADWEAACPKHRSYAECSADPECGWCSADELCYGRTVGANNCTTNLQSTRCPGICPALGDCHSCLVHGNPLSTFVTPLSVANKLGLSHCTWCVQNARCHHKDDNYGVCGVREDTSAQVPGWWGMKGTEVIYPGQCRELDKRPGLTFLKYLYPANWSQPDYVAIINATTVDFNVASKSATRTELALNGEMVARLRGFLRPPFPYPMNTEVLRICVSYSSAILRLTHGTNTFSTNLTADLSSGNICKNESWPSQIPLVEKDQRFAVDFESHKSGPYSTHQQSKMELMHFQAQDTPKVFTFEYLEPFASDGSTCNQYDNCLHCLTDSSCGWCELNNKCLLRSENETESCAVDGDWRYLTLQPSSCANCSNYISCEKCISSGLCEWWAEDALCARLGRAPRAVKTLDACPVACHARQTCSACLDERGRCVWCEATQQCFSFSVYTSEYQFGLCREWLDQSLLTVSPDSSTGVTSPRPVEQCKSCSHNLNCSTCLRSLSCGWCYSRTNPIQGACVSGDFNQPYTQCSEVLNTAEALWSYAQCPDVDECRLGLHNCHPEAECTNTHGSYSCQCKRGFYGDGQSSCIRTCYNVCVHGKCLGAPDYTCKCDLGWDGPDCSINCGCNNHSTCTQGIGKCDACQNWTTGEFCEQCLPGSYGNATTSQGCHSCDCNGHGIADLGYCDSITGVCYCEGNTEGDRCQKCKDKYYGDPRNGGQCYYECHARGMLSGIKSQGIGSRQSHKPLRGEPTRECLWVVSPDTKKSTIIQLSINASELNVTCGRNAIYVYDGLPDLTGNVNGQQNQLVGVFCSQDAEPPLLVEGRSGYLTVHYKQSTPEEGFSATYEILVCDEDCPAPRICKNGQCACPDGFRGSKCEKELCVNNCSSELSQGTCDLSYGRCLCNKGWGGADCSVKLSNTQLVFTELFDTQRLADNLEHLRNVLPRFGHTLVADRRGSLWMFGGYSLSHGPLNDLRLFDTRNITWMQVTVESTPDAKMPLGRYFHAAEIVPSQQSIYVYGGLTGRKLNNTLNDFWQFNIHNQRWSEVDTPDDNKQWPPNLAGHTLTLKLTDDEEKLILIGGFSPNSGFLGDIWEWDISKGQWLLIETQGAVPVGLAGHSTVYHSPSQTFFVFGGYSFENGVVELSNNLYTFHYPTKVWSLLFNPPYQMMPLRRFLHSAVTTDDFMLVFGGRAKPNISNDILLAYVYACNLWVRLVSHDGEQVGHVPPATYAHAMTLDIENMAAYVVGGWGTGQHCQVSQIHLPSDICSLWSYRKSKCLEHPGCGFCGIYSTTGQNVTKCHTNIHEDAEICSEFIDGTKTSLSGKSCTADIANRDCSQFQTCTTCIATWSVYGDTSSQCYWCDNKCISTKKECKFSDVNITSVNQCPERNCIATDCQHCQQIEGCVWAQKTHANEIKQSIYGNVGGGNIEYTTEWSCIPEDKKSSQKKECPPRCGDYTTCYTCLNASSGEGGFGECHWSNQLMECISPSYQPLYCVGGVCGLVLNPSDIEYCPEPCTSFDKCSTCLRHAHCGWCARQGEEGDGICTEGTLDSLVENPALSSCDVLYANVKPDENITNADFSWNYVQCPPEDECANGHHTCDLVSEVCVNLDVGFKCQCAAGYKRNGTVCVPVCSQGCVRGVCTEPNICKCDFGYVGANCSIQCQCNGHANCVGPDKLDKCLECHNNTMGSQCEKCKPLFVGDPSNGRQCVPCFDYCNGHTNVCMDINSTLPDPPSNMSIPELEAYLIEGPKTQAKCVRCANRTSGNQCEDCETGTFRGSDDHRDPCRPCECHGHGDTCDAITGENCNCQNNTESDNLGCRNQASKNAAQQCWMVQCAKCRDTYVGTPTGGHQCYKTMTADNKMCFDAKPIDECKMKPKPLNPGETVFFAVQPHFMNVDIRIIIDVTQGSLDLFLSPQSDTFIVNYNNSMGMHQVELDPRYRRKGEEHFVELIAHGNNSSFDKNNQPDFPWIEREIRGLSTYVTIERRNTMLVVRGLRDRLVLTLPQHKHELSTTKFYLVLQALNGDHSGRASYGMVFFRQDQLHIDLFVFFSVFFSCFFLFLAACVVAWKAKQAADIRRARRRHVVEMLHMAKRPFASVSLIIGPRTPVALRRLKSRGRSSYTTVGDVRPVAIEPTEDNVAAVATVFIKLPGGRQAPVRLALASSLILLARQFPPGGRAFLRRRSAQQALPPS